MAVCVDQARKQNEATAIKTGCILAIATSSYQTSGYENSARVLKLVSIENSNVFKSNRLRWGGRASNSTGVIVGRDKSGLIVRNNVVMVLASYGRRNK